MSEQEKIDPLLTFGSRRGAVVKHLCEGMSNKGIAIAMGLTEPTIKLYVKDICNKLNVHSRLQVVVWAARSGLMADGVEKVNIMVEAHDALKRIANLSAQLEALRKHVVAIVATGDERV